MKQRKALSPMWILLGAVGCMAFSTAAFPWSNQTSSLNKDEIKDVQQKLNSKGYHAGADDGIFGKQTADAVKGFQKDNHEKVTGNLDPQTLAALGVSKTGEAAGQAPGQTAPESNVRNESPNNSGQ